MIAQQACPPAGGIAFGKDEAVAHDDQFGPGIGAQGGDATATVRAGWRPGAPIIVSSSRAVLYASAGEDFAAAARRVALATRDELQRARPAH